MLACEFCGCTEDLSPVQDLPAGCMMLWLCRACAAMPLRAAARALRVVRGTTKEGTMERNMRDEGYERGLDLYARVFDKLPLEKRNEAIEEYFQGMHAALRDALTDDTTE